MSALVPPEALAQVRERLDSLADDIVGAARAARPEYDEALAGPDGLAIRLGIEQSLHELLRRLEDPGRASEEAREAWLLLGEREFQAGRSLEALQAAFRAGTRAAVRRAADLAADAGVSAAMVASLAEAIFVLVDELASAVIEGYVRAQSDEAGERDRARARLAALLLEGAEEATVARAAERARLAVPSSVAALAVDTDAPDRIAGRIGPEALAGADSGGAWVLLPAPARTPLARAIGDVPAALGPEVPPREAARSLRWARLALGLVRSGVLAPGAPVRAMDNAAAIVLLQDPELAGDAARDRLASLDALPAADRERLTETLASWLAHQRHVPSIAAALNVHPQTVRYRIGQLRELLGGALDDPDGRFELDLALRIAKDLGASRRR